MTKRAASTAATTTPAAEPSAPTTITINRKTKLGWATSQGKTPPLVPTFLGNGNAVRKHRNEVVRSLDGVRPKHERLFVDGVVVHTQSHEIELVFANLDVYGEDVFTPKA